MQSFSFSHMGISMVSKTAARAVKKLSYACDVLKKAYNVRNDEMKINFTALFHPFAKFYDEYDAQSATLACIRAAKCAHL
jgi:hypothetical protein